jgi:hypothetical protein
MAEPNQALEPTPSSVRSYLASASRRGSPPAFEDAGEPWRYHFYCLSPEDYTSFFEQVRNTSYAGWTSGLMQELAV